MNKEIGSIKSKAIKLIKESPSEDDVMSNYECFLNELRERAKLIGKNKKNKKEELVKILEQITEEAAKRTSTRSVRISLSNEPKRFGEKLGVETDTMTLPLYEDDSGELREWEDNHSKLLHVYIRSICAAITALSAERADGGFTKGDLYRRVPEALFLIDPFLHELKRQGSILFHHIPTANSPLIIYLKKRWDSVMAMSNEVIGNINKDARITYGAVRTVRCSKSLQEKWEDIVDREKDC